jgi:hypothetical protein
VHRKEGVVERPVDVAEQVVPGGGANRRGEDEGKEARGVDESAAAKVAGHGEGHPDLEQSLEQGAGDDVDGGVGERLQVDRLAEDVLVVGEADEAPIVAGAGVGEAEPGLEGERVGDDADDEDDRRRQEQRCQQPAGSGSRQPLTAPAVIPATKYSTKKE